MSLPATSRRNLASYRVPCGTALCIVSPGEECGASLALRIASASMLPVPEERQQTCLLRGSRAKRARPMSKHTRLVFSTFSTGVLALAMKHTSDDAAQSARWARHELFPSSKAQSLWRGECLLHSVCAPLREIHHSSVVSNVETVHYHSGAAHSRPKPDPPAFCCDPWLRVLTAYLSVCLSISSAGTPASTRCVSIFPDQQGFAVGSIEGRVGIEYFSEQAAKAQAAGGYKPVSTYGSTKLSFAFKCHRVTVSPG